MRFLKINFLTIFTFLCVFAGFAFAQTTVPDPTTDIPGWLSALFQMFASKEWGLVIGVLTVGVVALLKKLPTFGLKPLAWLKTSTWGKWIINIVVSEGTAVSTALFAHQKVTLGLIAAAFFGALGAAGALEFGKDAHASVTKPSTQ